MTFTSFSQIIGQEKAIKFLKQVVARKKLPHAYLFVGIQGIGKTTTAIALAQAINCHEPVNGDGCGRCRACHQIMSRNFLDLVSIKPDGQYIKIEQIRELNHRLSFKPVSGRYRVSIIHQAEMMNTEAANSFLKTLEEPPSGNILILNVAEPLDLLLTIVSRCQKVSFRPIPTHLIADWLIDKKNMDKDMALVLAKISEGSLGKAITMCNTDFHKKREDHLLRLISLPGLSPEQAIEMALKYSVKKKKKGPDTSGNGDYGLFDLLGIWKTWYRDLLLMKINGSEDLLVNIDFSRKLKNISKRFRIEGLVNSFLILNQAQRDLLRSRNLDLMMENTILALKRFAG